MTFLVLLLSSIFFLNFLFSLVLYKKIKNLEKITFNFVKNNVSSYSDNVKINEFNDFIKSFSKLEKRYTEFEKNVSDFALHVSELLKKILDKNDVTPHKKKKKAELN